MLQWEVHLDFQVPVPPAQHLLRQKQSVLQWEVHLDFQASVPPAQHLLRQKQSADLRLIIVSLPETEISCIFLDPLTTFSLLEPKTSILPLVL